MVLCGKSLLHSLQTSLEHTLKTVVALEGDVQESISIDFVFMKVVSVLKKVMVF